MRSNLDRVLSLLILGLLSSIHTASAQHFKRLGTCPTLGCILPPDQTDFYPGQLFDVRLEVHAPVNGSEAFNNGVPDDKFSFCIQTGKSHGHDGVGQCEDAAKFFRVKEPALEKWSFSWVFCSLITGGKWLRRNTACLIQIF